MKFLRTTQGRVPLRSEFLRVRGERYFTPRYDHSEKDVWLAQRFVHWLTLYAARVHDAGYEYVLHG